MKQELKEQLLHPSDEFTPVPFWFWNDHLTKEEIIRQIHDFQDKGVMGFVIHPRIGIPTDLIYLSDAYLDLVEAAVAEASKLGMTVILYDEAMYPSGSAKGLVVKDNPEYASRGLKMVEYPCSGPTSATIELVEGELLVSVQAVEKTGDQQIKRHSTVLLQTNGDSVSFTPPGEQTWSILLFVETYSKGHIRGIHFGEDDREPHAPASADLLNPQAMQKFIEITHDAYYKRLKPYFGNTIIAMFTDEPNILGRGGMRGLKPWTGGFLTDYISAGNQELDLPLLWMDGGEETSLIRKKYRKAINQRLTFAYYKQLHDWCEQHQIALTGHPEASDDIGLLEYFQIPGQDVVWRWVAPEQQKGIAGVHSTIGKCSSDAARHRGRRRNLNEFLGVCGTTNKWDLTAGDMKWYMDWLLVRGANMLCPHAFYYSVEGERRYNERPPDVGPNNSWWPFYKRFTSYMKRLSWLMTDSVNVTPIAVICEEDHLPWQIVKPLFEHQIEFNYLEEHLLTSSCTIQGGSIEINQQKYRVVLIEDWFRLESKTCKRIHQFAQSGGTVIVCGEAGKDEARQNYYAISDFEEVVNVLDRFVLRDAALFPASADLRVSHVCKDGLHFYMLVNEGEQLYHGTLQTSIFGKVHKWDPWAGTIVEQSLERHEQGPRIPLQLDRRQSIVFCVDPLQKPVIAD
ncbi:MAG: hypothetical protein JWN30_206, partial [Bacilli bacterium]|nr:hypothetical protein [Bacilli bacterium]